MQGERAKVLQKVHEMRLAAEELGEDFKVKNSEYSVYLRNSQVVDVDEDLSNVDVRFLIEQEPKVDKTKAKELLKKGEDIAGLTLKTNTSLQWIDTMEDKEFRKWKADFLDLAGKEVN